MAGVIGLFVILLGLFLILQLVVLISGLKSKQSMENMMDNQISEMGVVQKKRVMFKNDNGVIETTDGKFYLMYNDEDGVWSRAIHVEPTDYEVVLGETSISRKHILDTAGKAVVGGVLFGGLGAIGGILFGNSSQEKKFNKVVLRTRFMCDERNRYITVDNVIMDTGKAKVGEESPLYREAMYTLDYVVNNIETHNRRLGA